MSAKKFLALFLALLLSIGNFSLAYSGGGIGSGIYKGEDFTQAATKLIRDNWEDGYFAGIVLKVGSGTMTVDGAEYDITEVSEENGEVKLPLVDIAKAVGLTAVVSPETGEISVLRDGQTFTHEAPAFNASGLMELEDSFSQANSVNAAESTAPESVYAMTGSSKTANSMGVADNGAMVRRYADRSVTYSGKVSADEIERVLGLKATVSGDTVVLTSPYQMKQLVVTTQNGHKLPNHYGASQYITNGEGLYLLLYPTAEAARQAHGKLQQDPFVQNVVPNQVRKVNSLPQSSWGTERIQAGVMKEALAGSDEEIIVAVVDTGVDYTHSHLKDRVVDGMAFVGYTEDPMDDHGHGTHTSGTVVDCTPDNVKIMPIKVLDAWGYGDDVSIGLGILWAEEHGAKVINMSLGGFDDNSGINVMEDAIREVVGNGMTVVVSSGNEEVDINVFSVTPARMDEAITVGATDEYDMMAYFSNYGDALDVTAPGVGILSSYPGERYAWADGTSMSSPHVAAAAAMLLLETPDLTPAEVKESLGNMAVDIYTPGWDRLYGHGRIDFRLHFEGYEPIEADGIAVYPSYMTLEHSVLTAGRFMEIHVSPTGATEKTYTVSSSDEDVAVYRDGCVYAKGVGSATITFTTETGATAACQVEVVPSNHWVDFAAEEYAGGDGTAENPYLIATAEQLAKLDYDVAVGGEIGGELAQLEDGSIVVLNQKNYKLIADIDLAGRDWIPLSYEEESGGWITTYYSLMNIDGNGHAIYNMEIIADTPYAGFFGIVRQNEVKDLALIDANVQAGWFGPGIMSSGALFWCEFTNCYTSGKSIGSGFIGEIRASTFRNCFSVADSNQAGFAIYAYTPYMYNCYAAGTTKYGAGFIEFLDDSSHIYEPEFFDMGEIVNSFSAMEPPSGDGFARTRDGAALYNCYYMYGNPNGIRSDASTDPISLEARDIDFFTAEAAYTDTANWSAESLWDFENEWAIDANYNNGLPYLKNLPAPANREPEVTNTWIDYAAKSYAGGAGTFEDPFLIETPEQLAKLAKSYRYGGGQGAWFKLVNDIDLAGHDWFPIAGADLNTQVYDGELPVWYFNPFMGNILGDGHTVRNLNVSIEADCAGFIAVMSGGTIDGLTLQDVSVTGGSYVGGLAGADSGGNYSNCYVSGNVSGERNVGGLIGDCNVSVIKGSGASVTIRGTRNVGGLVGYSMASTIEGSFAEPVYRGLADRRAALVGFNNGIILNSYAIDAAGENSPGLVAVNIGKIEKSYYVGDGVWYLYRNTRLGGEDVTEEQLKDSATYEGWDFGKVWGMDPDENGGYPYLQGPVEMAEPLPTKQWAPVGDYAGGSGTAEDPYQIATPGQLAKMAYDIESGAYWPAAYFILVSDIDLGGKLWHSIGDAGGGWLFGYEIMFDGNGYEIQNMTVSGGGGFASFPVEGSVIKNLGITGIQGTSGSGISFLNEGTIVNCYTTGTIRNAEFNAVGGLVSANEGVIDNCYSTCDVASPAFVGSFVGRNFGTITNSYSTGTVTGGGLLNGSYWAGGFTAYNYDGIIQNCYYAGDLAGFIPVIDESQVTGTNISVYFDEELAYGGEALGYKYGKTTAEMKDAATYEDWDFENVWAIDPSVNNGYPYLQSLKPKLDLDFTFIATTDANLVKKGEYFDIEAKFSKQISSNAAMLTLKYDASKFEFAGYTAPEGVTLLERRIGNGEVTLTIMSYDYDLENLGLISMRAKVDAVLENGASEIEASVRFVYKDEAGTKTELSASAIVNLTTQGGVPGDTTGKGYVDLIDLSNVIDWFGKNTADPEWNSTYKFFDFNNNGEIDIYDIIFVAAQIK